MKKRVVSIVGATGLVGAEVLSSLELEAELFSETRLFASEDSAGEVYRFGKEELVVQLPTKESLMGSDIIVVSLPPERAQQMLPLCLSTGATIIDATGVLRQQRAEARLIAPAIEHGIAHAADATLFALPSAATSVIAPLAYVAHQQAGLVSVRATLLYSVSSLGRGGQDELFEQTKALFTQESASTEVLGGQVAFNCVASIDHQEAEGSTREESRVVKELRELLRLPSLAAEVTAVRVPVFHGHCGALSFECERPIAPEQFMAQLRVTPGLVVHDDDVPTPVAVAGDEFLHVGRVRKDRASRGHGITLWCVADNIKYALASSVVEAVRVLAHPAN